MPRARKNGKYINLKIQENIYDRFESYCEKEDRTKTAALERMITAYLNEYDKNAKKRKGFIYDWNDEKEKKEEIKIT